MSNEMYTLYILQQLFFYTAFGGLCASWAPVVTTAADEKRNTFTLRQKVIALFCIGLTILSFLIIIKCAKMKNLGDFFNNNYFLGFLVISLLQDVSYTILLFVIGIRFYVKFKDHVNINFCAPNNNNNSESSEYIIQAGYNKLCRMLLVIFICSALRFTYYCLGGLLTQSLKFTFLLIHSLAEILNYKHGYSPSSGAHEGQFIGPNASHRSLKVAVLLDIIPECFAMIALVWLAKPKRASSTISVGATSSKKHSDTVVVVSPDDRDPVKRISTTKNILQNEKTTPKIFDRTFSSDDEEDPYSAMTRPIEKGLLSDQHMINNHRNTGNSNENL